MKYNNQIYISERVLTVEWMFVSPQKYLYVEILTPHMIVLEGGRSLTGK